MKYLLLAAILLAFTLPLTACGGEGKPGQYPPSLYKDNKEGDSK